MSLTESVHHELWQDYQDAKKHDLELDESNIIDIVCNLGGINSVLEQCLNSKQYCENHVPMKNVNNLKMILLKQATSPIDEKTGC